jgi:hypothetical protein
MKIVYPHLLFTPYTAEGFLRLLIERIALGHKPCLLSLKGDTLSLPQVRKGGALSVATAHPAQLEAVLRTHFRIPAPCTNWGEIKKKCVKEYLLYQYAVREGIEPLQLWLDIATKKIVPERIILGANGFGIYCILPKG